MEIQAPPGGQALNEEVTTPAHTACLRGRISHLIQALKDDPGKKKSSRV